MALLALALVACDASNPAPVIQGGASAAPSPTNEAMRSPALPGAAHPHPGRITVLSGDTLYSIGRRYDIPVRAMIDANHLEPPYGLIAGSILVLPQVRTHAVQPGETLYGISRLYGVDATTLARENHMAAPYTVRSGTVLLLPPAAAPPTVAASPSTVPPPQPPKPPSAPPSVGTLPPVPVTPRSPAPPETTAAPPELTERTSPSPPPPAPPPPQVEPAAPPPEEMAALPPAPPRSGRNFLWPVRGRLIGHYGPGANGTHNDGINIAAPAGAPVVAADAGVVAYVGNELRGYGNLILIKHAGGWMTAYAHNESIMVKRGERVRRGQVIARVGATGAVAEPQLHFEIRKGTRALDPASYLASRSESAAVGGRHS